MLQAMQCLWSYLPELDIIELWVGMDVGVGNADELPPVGSFQLRRVESLQHCDQSHIVLYTNTGLGHINVTLLQSATMWAPAQLAAV